ncbi:MAG: metal ABC transporter permease [Oligoflexus sp.]
MIDQLLYYYGQYSSQILYSLFYFAFVAVIGLFLVLRRSSFFGLVLSQAAQFSFFLGAALHWGSHEDAYSLVNKQTTSDFAHSLSHLDIFTFPVTFLVMTPLILAVTKGIRNSESILAAALVFFAGLIPLMNAWLGGSDAILVKAYFTEILYTPVEHFSHYLLYTLAVLLVLLVFFRRFFLAGFDPTQAFLHGIYPRLTNILFFYTAGVALAIAVRILGVYVTMAAMLVPGLLALQLFKGLNSVVFSTVLFAIAFTLTGFTVSFLFDHLPAEPLLITSFCLFALLVASIAKLLQKLRS